MQHKPATLNTKAPTITVNGETFTEAGLATMIMTRHGARATDAADVARSMFNPATGRSNA